MRKHVTEETWVAVAAAYESNITWWGWFFSDRFPSCTWTPGNYASPA